MNSALLTRPNHLVAETDAADTTVRVRHLATITMSSAAGFIALFGLLHLLRGDLDPTWRFPSEYAIGRHGWMMVTAFSLLAAGLGTLAVIVHAQVRGWRSIVGQLCLAISAIGCVIAAAFPTDPSTTPTVQFTSHGKLHGFGASLLTALPIAIIAVVWATRSQAESHGDRATTISGLLAVASSVATAIALGVLMSRHGGHGGPDVRVGWYGRTELVLDAVWLATAAHTLTRTRTRTIAGLSSKVGDLAHHSRPNSDQVPAGQPIGSDRIGGRLTQRCR
jgi:Protein of unknown function (DUF998)